MKLIRYLISYFTDFLFPKSSLVKYLESMSSHDLIALLKSHPQKSAPSLPDITSLFPYRDENVRELIQEIKYASNKLLATRIAPAIEQKISTLISSEADQEIIVTFIPETQSRKEKRGFDQGSIILNEIKKFKCERNLLSWKRKVLQQSLTTSKQERSENMRGALICNNPRLVKGKIIIVLDDVCTTGATLYDAKRALEDSGAKSVILLTIAH